MQDQITTTAACEVGNCHRCRGTVLSLTSAHAVDLALERAYFGEVA
jgi:hypothetical protein